MTYVSTVGEYVRQLDLPQSMHLIAAGVAYYYGKRGTPFERARLWFLCSCQYFLFAWLGFRFGAPDYPLSYRFGPDPHVWRPIPGVIDIRTIDHIIQLSMGCVFFAASAATAVLGGLGANLARRFVRAVPAVDDAPGLEEHPV